MAGAPLLSTRSVLERTMRRSQFVMVKLVFSQLELDGFVTLVVSLLVNVTNHDVDDVVATV